MDWLVNSWFLGIFLIVLIQGNVEEQGEVSNDGTFTKEYYCENMPGINFSAPGLFSLEEDNNRLCRYRDEILYPVEIFRWRSGAGCMSFTPPDWLSKNVNMAICHRTLNNITYKFPIAAIDNIPLFFDYLHDNYTRVIAPAFKTYDLYLKWENCARNADTCCRSVMTNENILPNDEYPCPATWDAWSCFLPAKPDTISELPCPDTTSSSNTAACTLYSEKECFANGTWNQQTKYCTCTSAPVYRRRHNFHVIVLYVSIALSFPAVVIFMSYKNLRIMRVNLHRNLLIACILRNIFTIVSKEVAILDSLKPSNETNYVLEENGVGCRMIAYFSSVFANAIYACMLADGFYLHKLIVRVFAPDPNIYIMYTVTAVLSILPTTIWAILVAVEADEYCWMVDSSWYQWVPDGFRIAILCVNIVLLADIIRALLTKLKKNVTAQHTKSTLKAMSFLIPLFGVPFILTANRNIIDSNSCTAGDIFYYTSYLIQALQGVMVAVLFCYWNKEVHTQIKGTYRKLRFRYEDRFGSKNGRRMTTNRKDTAATFVHNSVAPQRDREKDVVDNDRKVNDWLTENKSRVDEPALEPTGNKNQVQFAENDVSSRISKFIDESSDNQAP